jgi:hypothetical protein
MGVRVRCWLAATDGPHPGKFLRAAHERPKAANWPFAHLLAEGLNTLFMSFDA